MPQTSGTGVQKLRARRAVKIFLAQLPFAMTPARSAAVCGDLLPRLQEPSAHRRRLSHEWPAHLNRKQSDLDDLDISDAMFRQVFRLRREHSGELARALQLPEEMKTPSRHIFDGTTGLLVLLARLGHSGSSMSLGMTLKMNPKRISMICTKFVRWLFHKWGHLSMGILLEERPHMYDFGAS